MTKIFKDTIIRVFKMRWSSLSIKSNIPFREFWRILYSEIAAIALVTKTQKPICESLFSHEFFLFSGGFFIMPRQVNFFHLLDTQLTYLIE